MSPIPCTRRPAWERSRASTRGWRCPASATPKRTGEVQVGIPRRVSNPGSARLRPERRGAAHVGHIPRLDPWPAGRPSRGWRIQLASVIQVMKPRQPTSRRNPSVRLTLRALAATGQTSRDRASTAGSW